MNKGYRINTNVISDTLLNVNLQQDFDFLEILSLKLAKKDTYRFHSSNYGVIIGRVLANDAFGIPNAKISVFIERDTNDSREIENIYPYTDVTAKDKNARRYNILPDYSDDTCYRVVGTFPNKRLLLDENIQLEIYDKYWKYTTVTNNAGDYMLFGVPTGSTTVHVDIDLSDIGILSQKPYDFLYKGYNLSDFDSTTQFKESTNLDYLKQIITQNRSVYVYPFWGDSNNGIACITRSDIQIEYQFETTCIFMGAIVSDNGENSIDNNCAVNRNNGMNDQLVASNGTIEMIRRTTDGLIEEFPIKSNYLIDNDGVWCYQIPMNLDYIGTDEFGNIVPIDNPNRGIATRAQVRFRISKEETGDEGFSRHTAKYLVPMNPILNPNIQTVNSLLAGPEVEDMYQFGSRTPNHCFRDLYWNNVYSVKNHIPKVQTARRPVSPKYSALKGANYAGDKNAIPFNKFRFDVTMPYMIICLIFTILLDIICRLNRDVIGMLCIILNAIVDSLTFFIFDFGDVCPNCVSFELDGRYFAPCCCEDVFGTHISPDCDDVRPDGDDVIIGDEAYEQSLDIIQRDLAETFKVISLDFYEDWLNGALYMPLWYWRKRKKRSFLFGLIKIKAKNDFCDCDNNKPYTRLKTYFSCNYRYANNNLGVGGDTDDWADNNVLNEERWHRSRIRSRKTYFRHGLIKQVENMDGLNVYYYSAIQPNQWNTNTDLLVRDSNMGFFAQILYATDIILLGNLNRENLWGLPQFFTALPQTTANVPPVGSLGMNNYGEEDGDNDEGNETDSEDGTIFTTGMDWGHDGGNKIPRFKSGLFMDLACMYIHTRLKSCFNVERLSELDTSLDTAHRMAYSHRNNNGQYPNMFRANNLYGHNMDWIEADGFINKYELDDTYNRSMFATMNHIGFIPQEAINDINRRYDVNLGDTQVEDRLTGYLIPKYKPMYLVDFDGRLDLSMQAYARNADLEYDQATWDETDGHYITYRLGAEINQNAAQNYEQKVRHFYYTPGVPDVNERFRMPYYNNSFYFYFGLTPGKTAIDKFNEGFYSECSTKDVDTFTLNVNTQGVPYCPNTYRDLCMRNAFIHVTIDSINKPYSFELLNTKNELILKDEDCMSDEIVIGRDMSNCLEYRDVKTYTSYTITYDFENKHEEIPGYIRQMANDYPDRVKINSNEVTIYSVIDNSEYTLRVIDANGNYITQKVEVSTQKIGFRSHICRNDLSIVVTEISIGGYDCVLDEVLVGHYNPNTDTYDNWLRLHNDLAQNIWVLTQLGCVTKEGNPIECPYCCKGDLPWDEGSEPYYSHTNSQEPSNCNRWDSTCMMKWKPNRGIPPCVRKWPSGESELGNPNYTYILTLTEADGAANYDNLIYENSASEIITYDINI